MKNYCTILVVDHFSCVELVVVLSLYVALTYLLKTAPFSLVRDLLFILVATLETETHGHFIN